MTLCSRPAGARGARFAAMHPPDGRIGHNGPVKSCVALTKPCGSDPTEMRILPMLPESCVNKPGPVDAEVGRTPMPPRGSSVTLSPAETAMTVKAKPGADAPHRQEFALCRASRAGRTPGSSNQARIHAAPENGLLGEAFRLSVEEGGCRLGWAGYADDGIRKTARPGAWAGKKQL